MQEKDDAPSRLSAHYRLSVVLHTLVLGRTSAAIDRSQNFRMKRKYLHQLVADLATPEKITFPMAVKALFSNRANGWLAALHQVELRAAPAGVALELPLLLDWKKVVAHLASLS